MWSYFTFDVVIIHPSYSRYDEELAQADAREREVKSRTGQHRFRGRNEVGRKAATWK